MWFLLACTTLVTKPSATVGPPSVASTGSTGDTGTTSTSRRSSDGPRVAELTVRCADDTLVELAAEATGWTSGGTLFMQETGHGEPRHAEEHHLRSIRSDAFGLQERLGLRLMTGASVTTQAQDQSTLFTCAGHFESAVMTYAVLITDSEGHPADCVVTGHDPAGLIEGTSQATTEPSFDLSRCAIAGWAAAGVP